MKKPSRIGKIIRMVIADLALLAVSLLSFAYFHHVRIDPIEPQQLKRPTVTVAPTPVPAAAATAEPTEVDASAEAAPEPTPEPTGLLRGQFSEKFSTAIVQDETSYRSENVAIELSTLEMYNSIVHLADIYINDITSLRTAVFSDYDKHYMHTLDMSKAAGAIVGLSGDHFYAHLQSGVFAIRNGQLYAEEPNKKQDACVLYYDGAMETHTADQIDLAAIYARDPYQVWYFGPGLLDAEGNALTSFKSTVAGVNPRAAIGYYEPGHYCFMMVEGRRDNSEGVTLTELAQIFEELGCKSAYNLDGGKTAVMTWNGELESRLLGGGREVADILYIAEPIAE